MFSNLCCKNKIFKNLYNGEWIESNSKKLIEIFSPVDGSSLGKVQAMTTEEVDMAIKNTKEAFISWKETSLSDRADILYKAADPVSYTHLDVYKRQ